MEARAVAGRAGANSVVVPRQSTRLATSLTATGHIAVTKTRLTSRSFFPCDISLASTLVGTDRSTEFSISEEAHANEVIPTLLKEIGTNKRIEDELH